MLTPTVANRYDYFYAAGNTPAINLARSVPHGQDADILSLGCGDLRYILYTSYLQSGALPRKLDITCCDYDEKVIGRNILLLTLIIDDAKSVSLESLWDIYYHWFLEDQTAKTVLDQVQKLRQLTASLEAWKAGPYASMLRICDEDTLYDVGRVFGRIESAALDRTSNQLKATFLKHIQSSKDCIGEGNTVLTSSRSAAPLSLQSRLQLPDNFRHYWSEGSVRGTQLSTKVPNPMFAGLVSEYELLHYGTDPLMGFHLATAFADLSEHSPLRPEKSGENRVASAAQVQFSEWVKSLRLLFKKKRIVLRFVVSEAFALCHTLQHAGATGSTCANWYRRQYDDRTLRLDSSDYGPGSRGPTQFDVIETSNLSDHVGTLNLAMSAGPLLKPREWAVVHTDQLLKGDHDDERALDELLCGSSTTASLLLGLTPFQYWTNSKLDSHVDEVYLGIIGRASGERKTQFHSRLAWRRDDQLGRHDPGRPMLRIDPSALARAVFEIYLQMFKNEKMPSGLPRLPGLSATYGHFHRGSFVALLKAIQSRVKTDWPAMIRELVDTIAMDKILMVGTNQIQDLFIQLHLSGLYTEAWVVNLSEVPKETGPFQGWADVPPVVAITVVMPRGPLQQLYPKSGRERMAAPTFLGSLKASLGSLNQWHNMYGDVHLIFGKATRARDSASGETLVKVEPDRLGWEGTSPLIASFMVPTEVILLESQAALVGLYVPPSLQSIAVFGPKLGAEMMAFETKLSDASHVFVSKFRPGQTGDVIACSGAKPLEDEIPKSEKGGPTTLKAEVDADGSVTEICGHVSISTAKGKKMLLDKVPIELHQKDPFVIDVVFGKNKLVCPLRFPVPVNKENARTRIARTSAYIEVIAPIAEPLASGILSEYVSPSLLTAKGLPVALNAPHLNLDRLPILRLDDKEELSWLSALTAFQFSSREKQKREGINKSTGMTADTRVNFKESLFTMFMLSSGLQGGQTGLFSISHPGQGGVHMIVLVSAIRLDGDTASVVLDAAVIPLTMRLLESRKLHDFLIEFQELQSATIKVNDSELLLWKKALPAMAERCRTWTHLSHCEYKQHSATIPLSLEHGEKVLCSCGNGKLPDDFVSVPEWQEASQCATRIAISPTYSVPFVEEVVDTSGVDMSPEGVARASRCRRCQKKESPGVTLKKCIRCKTTKYCSAECQKVDWKKHKLECEEAK